MDRDEPLSPSEQTVYNVIRNAAEEGRPASIEEIYKVLYNPSTPLPTHKQMEETIGPFFSRLRKKLPEGEIVRSSGLLYSKSATEY